MTKANISLPGGVRFTAITFRNIAILASVSQSAQFLGSQGAAQGQYGVWVLLLVSLGIIGSGVIFGRIAGTAIANGDSAWVPVMSILICMGIAYYSVASSTSQIIDAGHSTVASENSGSTRAQNLEQQIAANLASIKSYQEQIAKADPVRWKSKRDKWNAKIERIQSQNMVLMGQRDRVRESSTEKSFDDMEAMFGLTPQR